MRREEGDITILDESLIEDFAKLDTVVQLSYTVIFCPFIILEYNDILYFLVPDWKVDSS